MQTWTFPLQRGSLVSFFSAKGARRISIKHNSQLALFHVKLLLFKLYVHLLNRTSLPKAHCTKLGENVFLFLVLVLGSDIINVKPCSNIFTEPNITMCNVLKTNSKQTDLSNFIPQTIREIQNYLPVTTTCTSIP